MKKLLYLIQTDIKQDEINSGPTVRSWNIYEAFKKENSIDIIYGSDSKKRLKLFKEIFKKEHEYDFCYIESKVGVLRFLDLYMLLRIRLKLSGKKIGFYYRDMYWNYGIKTSKSIIKNLFVPKINKIYLNFLTKIINIIYVQSESFKVELSKLIKINNDNIKILPPGCEMIETTNIFNNEVIYVGEIDDRFSGVKSLIDTFAILNDRNFIILNIVCRKEEFIENEFLKAAEVKYKWLNIYHCNKSEIHKIYNKSSLAVIPRSGNEYTKLCLPIKFFEYISFEKPVVAIEHGETSKFIEENEIGVVTNSNPKDLAKGIESIIKNKDLYDGFLMNVKEVKKKASWEFRVQKIINTLTR